MDAALSFLDSPKQANKRQFPLAENLSTGESRKPSQPC